MQQHGAQPLFWRDTGPTTIDIGLVNAGRSLYLFTYGWRCPVRSAVLERLGVQAERLETVMANVPPAHVWRLRCLG